MRPAAQSLLFASPKKSNQKKGDPAVCVPALCAGQPAVLSSGGVSLNSHLWCSDRREPLSARPCAPRRRHRGRVRTAGQGNGRTAKQPNSQTAEQPNAPLLRSATRRTKPLPTDTRIPQSGPSEAMARVDAHSPCGRACDGVLAGWCGCAAGHTRASLSGSPWLFERSAAGAQ